MVGRSEAPPPLVAVRPKPRTRRKPSGTFLLPSPRRSPKNAPHGVFICLEVSTYHPRHERPADKRTEPHRGKPEALHDRQRKTPPRATTPPGGVLLFRFSVGFRARSAVRLLPSDPHDLSFMRLCAIFSIVNDTFNIPLFEFLRVLCVAERTVRSQNDLLLVCIAEVVFHKEDPGDRVYLPVLHIIDHLKIE